MDIVRSQIHLIYAFVKDQICHRHFHCQQLNINNKSIIYETSDRRSVRNDSLANHLV